MNRIVPFTIALLAAFPAVAWGQQLGELPSPYPFPEPAWSPYLVGGLIGLLVMLTLTFARKPVGASSAYADAAGLLGRAIAPRHIASLKFYREHKPAFGWSIFFVAGAVGGAFLAAWLGGELTGTYLQPMWLERFGPESFALRTLMGFAGGAVMAYGARMAGGCTSGHGISGALQLATGSWIALICFFVGGAAAALLLYRL